MEVWPLLALICFLPSRTTPTKSSHPMTPHLSPFLHPYVSLHSTQEDGEALKKSKETAVNNSSVATARRVNCKPRLMDANEEQMQVFMAPNASIFNHLLLNSSSSNVTNRTEMADCTLTFFYASWCPFSAEAAVHFNALARLYGSNISFAAIDSYVRQARTLNAQFGILAFPALILFHNGKTAAKFNGPKHDLLHFAEFVKSYTGQEPLGKLELLDVDFEGPVPTEPALEPDWPLYLAWLFVIVCVLYSFAQSQVCKSLSETVKRAWVEAELLHEHQE